MALNRQHHTCILGWSSKKGDTLRSFQSLAALLLCHSVSFLSANTMATNRCSSNIAPNGHTAMRQAASVHWFRKSTSNFLQNYSSSCAKKALIYFLKIHILHYTWDLPGHIFRSWKRSITIRDDRKCQSCACLKNFLFSFPGPASNLISY